MGTEPLQQMPLAWGLSPVTRLAPITSLQTIILKVPGTERVTRACLEQRRQRGRCRRQAPVSVGPAGEQPSSVPLVLAYTCVHQCTFWPSVAPPRLLQRAPHPRLLQSLVCHLRGTVLHHQRWLSFYSLVTGGKLPQRDTYSRCSFSVSALLDFSALAQLYAGAAFRCN